MLKAAERRPIRQAKAGRASAQPREESIAHRRRGCASRHGTESQARSKRTLNAEITEALARELRRRRLQGLVAEYEQEKRNDLHARGEGPFLPP